MKRRNKPNHDCSLDAPLSVSREDAFRIYAGWHRRNKTELCPFSKIMESASTWFRRHSEEDLYFPANKNMDGHDCNQGLPNGIAKEEATATHAVYHYGNGTPACDFARLMKAAWQWFDKGGRDDQIYYPSLRSNWHDCSQIIGGGISRNNASSRYRMHHQRDGTEICEFSRIMANARSWFLKNKDSDLYFPATLIREHVCVDSEDVLPSPLHYNWHIRKGTQACIVSKKQMRLYRWLMDHPDADPSDYEYNSRNRNQPFKVYLYHFANISEYYIGVTSVSKRKREKGYTKDSRMRELLDKGEYYEYSILEKDLKWHDAMEKEYKLIKQMYKKGYNLINIVGVPKCR